MSLRLKRKVLIELAVIAIIIITGIASFAGTINYTYDELNRLVKVKYENGTIITYTYDAAGNILSTTVVDNTSTPTAITLLSFIAEADEKGLVTLTWEMATEVNNAGFNIYRARLKDGKYARINSALIPTNGDSTAGATYSFVDTPGKGTFYYKLEDVDTKGVKTIHGPVKVRVEAKEVRRR
ncbi:MAG: RHS repeat protein [Planctomycetes bacterium]|nr:RHS repeat protein [Planctomycetota bacterium]